MQPTVHFTVNTLALKRGGLVKAVRSRANALAEYKAMDNIWIDVLGFQPRLEADVAALKAGGHLHQNVNVRSVISSLDDSDETRTSTPVTLPDDAEQTIFPAGGSGWAFRYFRDGLYEKYVRFNRDGTPEIIDYFTPERFKIRREEMDAQGHLVRVLHYKVTSTTPTVQRYFGRDGKCFLTIWQAPGKSDWGSSYLFGPNPRAFSGMGELYQHAFEKLLAPETAAVICSEFREHLYNLPAQNLDDVVRALRHPRLRKVATVHSNHLNPPYRSGSGVSATWNRLLAGLDEWDSLVLLTEAQRKDIVEDFGHADMLEVIPQVAPPEPPAAVTTDENRIVLVARTHPKKRVDEAIRVFRKVLDRNPNAVLEIFGFGYKDDEESRIITLTQQLGVEDSVRFMPFTDNPDDIYASACVTLLTSASEGFPLILLESMSYGVPVLAYDSNYGPRDVIVDGQNGFLVPFEDHDSLADRILAVMDSPDRRLDLGRNCRDTLSRFDTESFVASWTRVLSAAPSTLSEPKPATQEPVVRACWEGQSLVLNAGDNVPPGSIMVVRRRNDAYRLETPQTDRTWRVLLPPSQPREIFDFFLKAAGPEAEQRVPFGALEAVQQPPMNIYATAHGSLSVKNIDNRRP